MADQRPPLPYGPFTAEVRRFLQQLAALTPAEEDAALAEYQLAVASPEYQAAERVLGGAIARSGRERERDALGGPLLQMLRVQSPLMGDSATLTPNAVTGDGATLTPNAVTGDGATLTPNAVPAAATLTPTDDDVTPAPSGSAAPETPNTDMPSFRPVAEPALAALLAILMQDVLSAEHVARLYAPFARIIARTSLHH